MKIDSLECSQCGAADFTDEGNNHLRCAYCKSLYLKNDGNEQSGVTIKKGAKVIFGPSAKVVIHGKLKIEDGAEVSFNGNILLIEKASDKSIQQAKLRLKK